MSLSSHSSPHYLNLALAKAGAIFLTGDTMKRTLMLDMALVDEDTVESAVYYLLESVEDMLEEDVSLTEALVALGQAAAHIADRLESRGRLH